MRIFDKQHNTTDSLWIRTPDNEIKKSAYFLEDFYTKYNKIYHSFTLDNIKNFDIINDTLILESDTYFLVDNFSPDGSKLLPSNNYDNLKNIETNQSVSYWYDESKNYIIIFKTGFNGLDKTKYLVEIFVYDNLKNLLFTAREHIVENLATTINSIDPTVLTYNPYTKNYNLSFISRRNSNTDQAFVINSFFFTEKLEILKINIVDSLTGN